MLEAIAGGAELDSAFTPSCGAAEVEEASSNMLKLGIPAAKEARTNWEKENWGLEYEEVDDEGKRGVWDDAEGTGGAVAVVGMFETFTCALDWMTNDEG